MNKPAPLQFNIRELEYMLNLINMHGFRCSNTVQSLRSKLAYMIATEKQKNKP